MQADQDDRASSASSTNSRASSTTQLQAPPTLTDEPGSNLDQHPHLGPHVSDTTTTGPDSQPAQESHSEPPPADVSASGQPAADARPAVGSSSKASTAVSKPVQEGRTDAHKPGGREGMAVVLGMLMDECSQMSATAADMVRTPTDSPESPYVRCTATAVPCAGDSGWLKLQQCLPAAELCLQRLTVTCCAGNSCQAAAHLSCRL